MSNQYFNFYYDPVRQGYDSDSWITTLGSPVVESNVLKLDQAGAIHTYNLLRGDFVFNAKVSAPAAGDDTKLGLFFPGKGAYAYFWVENDTFFLKTSLDGVTVNTISLDWDPAWSDEYVEYRIKWEAGTATFYINGQFKGVISDLSVSGDPMSLYVYSNSTTPAYIKYIEAKGVQSLI